MTRHRGICTFVAVLLVVGVQNRASASVVSLAEVNNTPGTAQNVDGFFSLDYSPDIGDATGANTSLIMPHVTVDALGVHANAGPNGPLFFSNQEFDWFSFTVHQAGAVGIFDIDYGMDAPLSGSDYFDSYLQLLDTDGVSLLAYNDDVAPGPIVGAGGSTYTFDAFIEYTFNGPGLYYVGVGKPSAFGAGQMWGLFAGEAGNPGYNPDYALQISLGESEAAPSVVPEPATMALLSIGLLILSHRRRQRS